MAMLLKVMQKVFVGRPKPAVTFYTYQTGYSDYEATYTGVPDLGVELKERPGRGHRLWVNCRIHFEVDETVIEEARERGHSKYVFTDELLAIAQTKPTTSLGDAFRDYTLVAEDVGRGRIKTVSFLLYDGPEFPKWFYDFG